MSETSLLDTQTVAQRRARSRAQLYIDVRNGLLPPPLPPRTGRKVSAWPEWEITALNEAEASGASDEELRELVQQLIGRRARLKQTRAIDHAAA